MGHCVEGLYRYVWDLLHWEPQLDTNTDQDRDHCSCKMLNYSRNHKWFGHLKAKKKHEFLWMLTLCMKGLLFLFSLFTVRHFIVVTIDWGVFAFSLQLDWSLNNMMKLNVFPLQLTWQWQTSPFWFAVCLSLLCFIRYRAGSLEISCVNLSATSNRSVSAL